MSNNDSTYMELIALRDRLDARQTELQGELEDVTRKLESVSTTLALLDGSTTMPLAHGVAVARPVTASIDVTSLRGLKQVEALVKIAQHNGGQIRTADAKRLFLQSGLIKNPKNANNILFSVIQRSGKFERIEPGLYRLVGDKPERPDRLFPQSPEPK